MSRILVADGDRDSCGFIYRILLKRRIGEFVEVANDGFCAYGRLRSDDCDLAILDRGLPGLPGLDLVRKLRAEKVKTKVILLCDRADPELAKEVVLSGAQDLLQKPILLDSLVYSLRRCLQREKLNKYEWAQMADLSMARFSYFYR